MAKKKNEWLYRALCAALVVTLTAGTAVMTPVADIVGTSITANAAETWTEVSTYSQLSNAVAAGGNIKLTSDIDTNGNDVTISKACTIDFNGKKLTITKNAKGGVYINAATTLKNGEIYHDGTNASKSRFNYVHIKADTTIDGMKIRAYTNSGSATLQTEGKTALNIVIKDTEIISEGGSNSSRGLLLTDLCTSISFYGNVVIDETLANSSFAKNVYFYGNVSSNCTFDLGSSNQKVYFLGGSVNCALDTKCFSNNFKSSSLVTTDKDGTVYSLFSDAQCTTPLAAADVATAKAVYSKPYVASHTVTWQNYDGTTLETDEDVEEGTTPEYNGTTPTKEGNARYTYTFSGWDNELTAVTGDVTYTAQFTETDRYAGYTEWTATGTDENGNSATVTCYWKVDNNNKLYIAGTIPNTNDTYTKIPWCKDSDIHNNITEVYVEEGTKTSTDASYLFYRLSNAAKIDVSNLDTSNAASIGYMFYNCSALTSLDLSSLNTSNVTKMSSMFSYCSALTSLDLSSLNTSNATAMGGMFSDCSALTSLDVSGWDTKNVTSMYGMFQNCSALKSLDLSGWNTSNVRSMGSMFYSCRLLKTVYVDDSWNTDAVTSSDNIFYECYNIKGGNGTGYNRSYRDLAAYAHIDGKDGQPGYFTQGPAPTTYTVTWQNYNGTTLETDENVEEGSIPEYNGTTPTKEGNAQYSYTFSGWTPEISAVAGDVTYTAQFTESVNEYTVTWVDGDGNTLTTDTVAYGETPVYSGATPTKTATAQYSYTFSGWTPEISAVTGDVTYTAQFTESVNEYTVTWVDGDGNTLATDTVAYGSTPEYNGTAPTKEGNERYTYTFSGWGTVSAVTGNVTYTAQFTVTDRYEGYTEWTGKGTDENGNETNVTCYWKVENGKLCIAGTVPNTVGDQSNIPWYRNNNIRTSIIEVYAEEGAKLSADARYLFSGLTSATKMDLSHLDTSNTTDISGIFYYCNQMTQVDLSNWDTSSVTSMNTVFYECNSLTSLDLSGFNVSNVTTMNNMFLNCNSLTSLNVSGWNTSKVLSMGGVFTGCASLTSLDLSTWDTSRVDTMQSMFNGCRSLTSLDLSSWNTSSVKNMSYMFFNCTALTTVYVGDDWNTNNVTSSTDMFTNCTSLVGGKRTTYDDSNPEDKTYAHIDGGTSNPGYLTSSVTANTYTVTWQNYDGTTLETDEDVEEGTIPEYNGTTPTKEGNAQYSYTFSGWTPEISAVAEDVTYTAQFTESVNEYTVTWVDGDGNTLATDTVAYGSTPEYNGTTPTKEGTAQYSYTFSGWTPEISAVTGDVIYTAVFEKTVAFKGTIHPYNNVVVVRGYVGNSESKTTSTIYNGSSGSFDFSRGMDFYSVSKECDIYDENGTQINDLFDLTVEQASSGYNLYTYSPKQNMEKDIYVFDAGTEFTLTLPEGIEIENKDVILSQEDNVYTIKPVSDVTLLSDNLINVYSGSKLLIEDTKYKAVKNNQFVYETRVTGQFNAEISTAKIIRTQAELADVKAGDYIMPSETLNMNDAGYTWFEASKYLQVSNGYYISGSYGTSLRSDTESIGTDAKVYENGSARFVPANPDLCTSGQYDIETYKGNAWKVKFAGEEYSQNRIKLTGVYYPEPAEHEFIWADDNRTATVTFNNGEPVDADVEIETDFENKQFIYTATAVYNGIPYIEVKKVNIYTVEWKNDDGTILETDENVEYGTTPEYNGTTPTKEGTAQYSYTFSGWTPEISAVTGDVTYTAQFTETTNTYTVTWQNEDGTVLETDTDVAYGTTPSYDGAAPTKESTTEYRYIFSGWTPSVDTVTGDVVYTATFTQERHFIDDTHHAWYTFDKETGHMEIYGDGQAFKKQYAFGTFTSSKPNTQVTSVHLNNDNGEINTKDFTGWFQSFTSLKEVTGKFPEKVERMGSTFYNCKSLTYVEFVPEVTVAATKMFSSCTKLSSIGNADNTIKISCTSYQGVFQGCYVLNANVVFNKSLNAVNIERGYYENAFENAAVWGGNIVVCMTSNVNDETVELIKSTVVNNTSSAKQNISYHHYSDYIDNGDGTHSHTCDVCGESETENHTFDNGICTVCGSKEDYTMTVTNGIVAKGEKEIYHVGDIVTLKADEPEEGKVFAYWADGSGNKLSTKANYSFVVLQNIDLTAVYENEYVAEAILNISAVQTSSNGKNAIRFVFTRSVDTTAEVEEVGLIYATNKLAGYTSDAKVNLAESEDFNIETALKENTSGKVKSYKGASTSINGTVRFTYAVGSNTDCYVYAYGYVKLTDGTMLYTDLLATTYNSIVE